MRALEQIRKQCVEAVALIRPEMIYLLRNRLQDPESLEELRIMILDSLDEALAKKGPSTDEFT